jgi:AsmA protein
MNKPIKITLAIIAALILLVVGAATVFVATFDANDYKDRIKAQVAERTGRELSIPGDISLSVFPWIGVETGRVMLENAKGFGEKPFVQFDSAEVKVKLIPLLSRNVQVKSVNISGLDLNLSRNKQGETNWDDLVEARSETISEESGKDEGGPGIKSLTVGGVNIDHANLAWNDEMRNKRFEVSDLNVSTGRVTPGKPADIELTTEVSSNEPAAVGTIEISTTVHLGDAMEKGSLSNLELTLDLSGEGLPGGELKAVINGNVELDMKNKVATVSDLRATAYDVSLSGNAKVLDYDTEPVADVALSLAEFNPKKVMRDLGLEPIATRDPDALTRIAGDIDGRFSAKTATVRSLDVRVDQTALSGSAKAKDFSKPDLDFDFKADTLDLDRYMPPKKEGAEKAEKKDGGQKKKDEGMLTKEQREQLRKMVLDGRLEVGVFRYWKMTLNDVVMNISARNGVFDIDPLNMRLYGGAYKSAVQADFTGERMATALNLNLSDMQLGSLLKDVMGSEKVTGLARLNLDIKSVGEAVWPFLRNLDGGGSAGLSDGAFKGFQVVPEPVQKQVDAQDKTPEIGNKVTKQQKFKTLATDFNVDDGVLKTKTMKLVADGLGATGDGSIDLAEQTIDYKALVDMTALPLIPFTITGPLTKPNYSLNTSEFLKYAAKDIINLPLKAGKGAVDLGGEALKGGKGAVESLGEAIGGGLKGLFGGGEKKEQPAQ